MNRLNNACKAFVYATYGGKRLKRVYLSLKDVDMIVGDIAVSKEREMVMDFTFPFYYGYSTVILKRPDPDRFKWRKLVDPLKVSSNTGCLPVTYQQKKRNSLIHQ